MALLGAESDEFLKESLTSSTNAKGSAFDSIDKMLQQEGMNARNKANNNN